jgi:hypothetical protein
MAASEAIPSLLFTCQSFLPWVLPFGNFPFHSASSLGGVTLIKELSSSSIWWQSIRSWQFYSFEDPIQYL